MSEEKRGRGRPPVMGETRAVTIRLRLTKDEKARIGKAAESRDETSSEFLRNVGLAEADKPVKRRRKFSRSAY